MARFDVSQITDQLFISAWPGSGAAEVIDALGIDLVVSATYPPRACRQTRAVWHRAPSIDSPITPIPMRSLISGVQAAIPVLERGGRVLVHCREGRHRSVVQACAILIALGVSAHDAMSLIRSRREIADPHAFWIEPRIHRFQAHWDRLTAVELTDEPDPAVG